MKWSSPKEEPNSKNIKEHVHKAVLRPDERTASGGGNSSVVDVLVGVYSEPE